MEQFLDIRTLSFISGCILVVLCIVMLTEYYLHKVYTGFLEWTIANILLGIGFILMSLRGRLPDFLSIVAANAACVAYCQLITIGLAKFFSLRVLRRLDIVMWVIFLISFIHFTYVSPDISARTVVISVILAAYLIRISRLLRLGARIARFEVNQMLFWTCIIVSGWLSLRAILLLAGKDTFAIIPLAGLFDSVTFTIALSSYILCTVGLIQINTSRIEKELLDAQKEIQTLSGFLPICAHCKNIRDDEGYWNELEMYISSRTDAKFTHSICPKCMKELYPEYSEREED